MVLDPKNDKLTEALKLHLVIFALSSIEIDFAQLGH